MISTPYSDGLGAWALLTQCSWLCSNIIIVDMVGQVRQPFTEQVGDIWFAVECPENPKEMLSRDTQWVALKVRITRRRSMLCQEFVSILVCLKDYKSGLTSA